MNATPDASAEEFAVADALLLILCVVRYLARSVQSVSPPLERFP